MDYQYNNVDPGKKDLTGVCTWALITGIVAFFCNPLYLMPLAAIILGIIGIANGGSKKGMAIAGLVCGIIAIPVQIGLDLLASSVITVGTLGYGILIAWIPWII